MCTDIYAHVNSRSFKPLYCHHNMYISSVHLGYPVCFRLESLRHDFTEMVYYTPSKYMLWKEKEIFPNLETN